MGMPRVVVWLIGIKLLAVNSPDPASKGPFTEIGCKLAINGFVERCLRPKLHRI